MSYQFLFRTQTEKKTKPQDLIRLCDTVIENSCEILELPGASANKDLEIAYKAKAEYYRALRFLCFLSFIHFFFINFQWGSALCVNPD